MIHIEDIGKRYRITEGGARYNTLRDTIAGHALRLVGRGGPRPTTSDFWALRNVSLDVAQGEVVGIIGRNGAGKSTLLKILSRIMPPTEGRIRLRGRVASLLEVGTGFHPELTGRENVFMNGAVLGMRRDEIRRKFDEIVSFSEVEKFLDTPVKHYSSGMYVRLAFAVAAHLEPEILIVDEVLAVGDAQFQRKCLGKMGEVAQGGRTVLFVSHNMGSIQRLCQSAVLLAEGRIRAKGSADEVVDEYHRIVMGNEESGGEKKVVPCGKVGFVTWRVSGGRANDNYASYAGDPCTLTFDLVANRPVEKSHYGCAIWSDDGNLIWAMRSIDNDGDYVPLKEGTYTVSFIIPQLPLKKGKYQLQVNVLEWGGGSLDMWHPIQKLTILPPRESGISDKWQGILNISGKFEMRPT